MRIARFEVSGEDRWGFVDGETIRAVASGVPMVTALADPTSCSDLFDATQERIALDAVRIRAPIPQPPQFIGVGLNYHDHARELGLVPPAAPVTFGFLQSAIVGPLDPIELPGFTERVDWEAELAIVIGRGGRDIPHHAALGRVAGYVIVNDVSARDIQESEGQWGRAKSFDTFKPMGPWIVGTDDLGDASGLAISLSVNDISKQSSNTSQLVFDVPTLVSLLSRSTTLLPGSVIATGTPGGVGFSRTPPEALHPGDEVSIEIEGIGVLTNPVVNASGS
jgi:2-keto-4-pentenoate hydratase/2-oxohepta-3-ene-1,7-dioic acid hydratase in catechol pathway